MKIRLYPSVALLSALLIATACADNTTSSTKFETLKCIGTEPFWSLDLKDSTITFEDIDSIKASFKLSKAEVSSNHTNRWFITAIGNKPGESLSMSLIKTKMCSDDMSDFNYEYDMTTLINGTQVLSGCCNRMM